MSRPPLTADGFKLFAVLCLLGAVAFLCFAIDYAWSSGLRSPDATRVKRPDRPITARGRTVPPLGKTRGF